MDELDPGQRLYLDRLREEYERRHGAGVEALKSCIGPGELYCNAAGRILLSPRGAWFECVDQPMEFTGIAGIPVPHRLLSTSEARATLDMLIGLSERAQEVARFWRLLVLYSRQGIADGRGIFLSHFDSSRRGFGGKTRIGRFRPGEVPLLFRIRFELASPIAGLPFQQGAMVCLCGIGEGHLLVEMPHDPPGLQDLGACLSALKH